MKNSNKPTRSNKNEKNRTISRVVTLIIVVTVVLMLIIFGVWLIGGSDNNASNESMETFSSNIESTSSPKKEESFKEQASVNIEKESNEINKQDKKEEDEAKKEKEKEKERLKEEQEKTEKEKVKTKEADPSDDNVTSAVTGNWKPAETKQEGAHTTNYNDGSQDRIEIKQASANATDLSADNIIEWRVENNGDQKVVATISDTQQTKTYRVFLNWIDSEGWQPTKVEQLKVNDQR